jgi:glycosyltransferase involved in cell wall biosynthesis
MGPRRVAVVVHAVVPGDPRVRRQADALLDAGYEVDLFCLRAGGQDRGEGAGSLRIIRLPVNRVFGSLAGHLAEYLAFAAVAAWRLAREHRSRRYDLVQVATVPDFLVFAALPEKLGGIPILLDLHEDMPAFFRDRFPEPMWRRLMPAVIAVARASAAVADELITVHEPLRQLSIGRGVPPHKISVVMNSADRRIFDPSRHPRRPFMSDGRLRLIHHSNLQRVYGLDLAIEALPRLRPGLDWQLDVYGDGPWRPNVQAAITRTGTGERVFLHGRVPIDDLPGLLSGSDIGLVPSVPEPYLEYSLSTKLLEYAAMGVPTIATDLATFRHHFTDAAVCFVSGGTDALVQAIESLASHPDRTAEMGLEMQRQADAYDWDLQQRRYVAIVERLTRRNRRRRKARVRRRT